MTNLFCKLTFVGAPVTCTKFHIGKITQMSPLHKFCKWIFLIATNHSIIIVRQFESTVVNFRPNLTFFVPRVSHPSISSLFICFLYVLCSILLPPFFRRPPFVRWTSLSVWAPTLCSFVIPPFVSSLCTQFVRHESLRCPSLRQIAKLVRLCNLLLLVT